MGRAELSLAQFIQRRQVRDLYREALRVARASPSPIELGDAIRAEFRTHAAVSDTTTIRFLLSDGRVRLRSLQTALDLACPPLPGANAK
ncbi:LYR motif-containing protein 2 [Plasmodiophora brassicae]